MQQTNNQKPCERSYLCEKLREGKCSHRHTEEHKSYANIRKFLRDIFITEQQQKLILGKVKKQEGSEKFKLLPCNKEIIQQYPELSFSVIEDSEAEILSEEFYYEAKYEERDDRNGAFYVKIIKEWRKIGEAKYDLEAFFYGQVPIYDDEKKFTGNLKQGVFHEKRNGEKIIKCEDLRYFVMNEKDQNRALSGSTVKFREVAKKCAQIVSIVKNPFEDADIYGMLEASSDEKKQIDMEHLYCPLPGIVNWALLEDIFRKTGERLATSFKNSTITRKEFKDKYAVILQAKPEDSNVLHLTDPIFPQKKTISLEVDQMKKRWDSLYNLVNHQKQMNQAQENYYFKPLNKDLPTFRCLPIRDDLLKENPEIWRSYVRVKYIGWPAASKHPWVKIENVEGLIGDSEDDTSVILKKNRVTTDWFSKEVQENERELLEAWNEKIEESLESCEKIEEKVFTIDGESTRYRDDGFSVKKIAGGEHYEIGIHIADVTRVVKEETEIYKEAENRFHSCYIGKDFFRPMLSKKLGEHLSLKQDQWRYAFSAFILMNKEGVIDLEKTRFKHVMIKPARNFTYKQVDQIIASQAADDEVKEAILLMNELGEKLNERRKRLGCRLEIDEEEEDSEKNGPARMMVEEFMVLANEVATDFVRHQEEILSNKLVKIRNEEKRIVRESAEKKEEEQKKEKEEEETEEKAVENVNGNVKDKAEEKGEEKEERIKEEGEIEEKEEKISEKVQVSEDEEEVEIKRRGSESEEKSQTDSDFSSSNERKMKEGDAIKACNFLVRTWRYAIDDELDLSNKLAFLESQRRMKESKILTFSLRKYLEYLLRVKNQMIELVIRKKLPVRNSQDQIESPLSNFGAQMQRIQSPGILNTSPIRRVFEEEKSPVLGEESPLSSPVKSPLEEIGLKFAIKITKSKPKKKSKYQQKETAPEEIREEKKEPGLLSPEITEKISANNEEITVVQTKDESENMIKTEEIPIVELPKEEPEKKMGENEVIEASNVDQPMVQEKSQEISKEDEIKGDEQIKMEEVEDEEEGFSVKQSENIMKRYDHLENSHKMKFTSPIRRFSDILVHGLIDEILQIEEEIRKINETIQEKLAEQERENEEEVEGDKKKKKKIKTRYQIFQDLDSQLKNRISQLEKLQKKIRIYYEENSSNKKGGMSRAEREKDHMEVCRSVITGQGSILADALVVEISEKEKKINLFLWRYSVECTLSCWKVETFGGQRAKIYFADKSSVELRIFQDIKVEINVKKTFPLDFEVSYRKNKK